MTPDSPLSVIEDGNMTPDSPLSPRTSTTDQRSFPDVGILMALLMMQHDPATDRSIALTFECASEYRPSWKEVNDFEKKCPQHTSQLGNKNNRRLGDTRDAVLIFASSGRLFNHFDFKSSPV